MSDRFSRGLIAGVLAGIFPFLINHGAYALKLTSLRWADFIGIFITGSRPSGPLELVFAVTVEFAFLGLAGVIFAYLVPLVGSANYWLKGITYGGAIWFISYSVTIISRLSGEDIPLKTSVTSLIAGLIWGLALGVILKRLGGWVESS